METINITSPQFDESEIQEVREALQSGWVTQGPKVKLFEDKFKEYHPSEFALATTSCTAALHLSTLALDLKPGDEVLVPAFTWVTSAHCAEYVGASVKFVDVDPTTFNIDPKKIEAAITPKTKAMVIVHLFGLSADMTPIMEIAKKHNLYVIEDAACAIGSRYKGQPVGTIGDTGCFSFHPRKVITTGEGGMVTTNSSKLANRVESLRNHGATGHPEHARGAVKPYTMGTFNMLGFNLRLCDIQAAVGVAQLRKFPAILASRRAIAERYHDFLSAYSDMQVPVAGPDYDHSYQSYVIRVLDGGNQRRNQIMDDLNEVGIQTRPGTHAAHALGYYQNKYGIRPEDFPVALSCELTTITLPLSASMTDHQFSYVTKALDKAFKRGL